MTTNSKRAAEKVPLLKKYAQIKTLQSWNMIRFTVGINTSGMSVFELKSDIFRSENVIF